MDATMTKNLNAGLYKAALRRVIKGLLEQPCMKDQLRQSPELTVHRYLPPVGTDGEFAVGAWRLVAIFHGSTQVAPWTLFCEDQRMAQTWNMSQGWAVPTIGSDESIPPV